MNNFFLLLAIGFKEDIKKAVERINSTNLNGKYDMPLYLKMLQNEKEAVEYIVLKNHLGDILKNDFEKMATALSFIFHNKNDFLNFNAAMTERKIYVYSSCIVMDETMDSHDETE